MPRHESNRRNSELRIAQARKSPVRARILDLYEQNRNRSMAPADLLSELDALGVKSLGQVDYHLRRLQDLGLLPAPFVGR
jgi:DNA-binding transcriptional ArsR family regulator